MLRGVHTQSAGVGRGLVGRVRPRRNLSTQAPKEEPNPSTLPPPAEEPITHTVESLTESYYAFQDSVLNIQVPTLLALRARARERERQHDAGLGRRAQEQSCLTWQAVCCAGG